MNGYDTGLNGLRLISRQQFENAEFVKDIRTLYIVNDSDRIFLYLGEKPLPFFLPVTQAEYDALEHPDERTLYIISVVATPPESE